VLVVSPPYLQRYVAVLLIGPYNEVYFILVVPCIVNLFYVSNQRDAILSSLFIVLQNHSTCLGVLCTHHQEYIKL